MSQARNIKEIDFEVSFKEYYAPLCRYAYSFILDQDESEDLVQDIFLKICDKSPSIESSLSSYLYRAVKNACINQMKKKVQLTIVPIEEIEDQVEVEFELNREENMTQIEEKVERAINNLPPKCQEIFLMRRNMQMSYNEIATSLDISKKTIENQMNLAIKKLRSQLNKSDLLVYFLFIAKR
jgi:RNA polymerase sigma-70 factor (ECF subfamily)